MQVILLKQVNKLGGAGDVKDVADGFFRNFLMPRGLARPVTPAGLVQAERMRAAAAQYTVRNKEKYAKMLEAIKKEPLQVLRKANEEGHLFGSVSEQDITAVLSEKGFEVEERHVVLESPIKTLGTHSVLLRFDEEIQGTISIAVEREK